MNIGDSVLFGKVADGVTTYFPAIVERVIDGQHLDLEVQGSPPFKATGVVVGLAGADMPRDHWKTNEARQRELDRIARFDRMPRGAAAKHFGQDGFCKDHHRKRCLVCLEKAGG